MNPTTPSPYAVGDLVTVISDEPTFRVNYGGTCPSSAEKGETYRVDLVWRDGDLTLSDPESGEEGSIVVSPEHVEPYVAPVITAPFADFDVEGYAQAIANGWGTIVDTLWTLPTEPEPVDPMDRRADALEEAIDLLGDDRLVEDYVAAALFLLGEEA